MTKLIIVCGLSGSGKTTLAKELSKKTNIVCLHKDLIKESLYEIQKLSSLEDSKRIGKQSVELLLKLAEDQLANDVDIIIESPFNFSEDYPRLEKIREKYGLNLYSVICSIDADERKKRFLNRLRHRSHHDYERMKDFFPSDVAEYDYTGMPGKQILIQTNRDVGELVSEVFSQIV